MTAGTVTLDFYGQRAERPDATEPFVIWSTTVPSRSKPGTVHTIKRLSNGTYQCDCWPRRKTGICDHVEGAMLMLDKRRINNHNNGHATREIKAVQRYIDSQRKLRPNTLIAWRDAEFQETLTQNMADVLRLIIADPGKTRNDYVMMRGGSWNHTAPRITALLQANLIIENGTKAGPTGQPRALLYPNKELLEV